MKIKRKKFKCHGAYIFVTKWRLYVTNYKSDNNRKPRSLERDRKLRLRRTVVRSNIYEKYLLLCPQMRTALKISMGMNNNSVRFSIPHFKRKSGCSCNTLIWMWFQVPAGTHRTDLVTHLERLPILCQQLNFTLKSPTVGKSATFNKVDTVIQQTKDLMNCVAKVVTTCFICATKVSQS